MVRIGATTLFLGVSLFVSSSASGQALGKEYGNLLKKQGYQPLKAPRSDFGPGSLVPTDNKKNIFIASQADCFPDLDKDINVGATKLIDSKSVKNLSISGSGNYSPTGSASFLSKLGAAFGFGSKATMDVAFGDTTALNLTAIELQNYLTGHKISPACRAALSNPKTAIIFSVAKVTSMTYSFSGDKSANASANVTAAVGQAITGSGNLTYDHTTDNSVRITTPLFVGYNAFSLKDLQIGPLESFGGALGIASVKVTKMGGPVAIPLEK